MPFKRRRKSKGGLWVIAAVIAVMSLWQKVEANNFSNTKQNQGHVISCYRPYIIDGDTLTCSGTRIRLANIDAPEMPGHCQKWKKCTSGDSFASKNYLRSISGGSVTCVPIEIDRYGRTVALCKAGSKDLSCAMVAAGHAVERYGVLNCK